MFPAIDINTTLSPPKDGHPPFILSPAEYEQSAAFHSNTVVARFGAVLLCKLEGHSTYGCRRWKFSAAVNGQSMQRRRTTIRQNQLVLANDYKQNLWSIFKINVGKQQKYQKCGALDHQLVEHPFMRGCHVVGQISPSHVMML